MSSLEQYENGLALVYKFGERFDGELSAREGINFYALHAKRTQWESSSNDGART